MENKLQRGNIIKLKKSKSVIIRVKEKFISENHPFSKTIVESRIYIGDVLERKRNDRDIKDLFFGLKIFLNNQGIYPNDEEIENFINVIIKDDNDNERLDTSIYEGEYIVTSAETVKFESKDAWRVVASMLVNGKVDSSSLKVMFYQTEGCVPTILPEDIEVYDDILDRISRQKL